MILKNAHIVLEDEIIKGDVQLKNGKIFKIASDITGEEIIDCNEKFLVPGFIDVHIHGIGGHDAMDGTDEDIIAISKNVLKHGVTSYLPTLLTESVDRILNAFATVENVKKMELEDGANIIGVHMEGPFFADEYKGAQNPDFLQ